MRLLLAPLEMKGLLTAAEVADVMARALADAWPEATWVNRPLADGGPGTLATLAAALPDLRLESAVVQDPLGRSVQARWGWLEAPVPTAFIEAAEACGLWRLAPQERDPLRTSTHGVGQLIGKALDRGVTRVVVGLGGSATNDGGAGALVALGARLLDASGRPLPPGGGGLSALAAIDLEGLDPRRSQVRWELATDVQAPLLGPHGASRLFAGQKGAAATDVDRLEQGLTRLADVLEASLGRFLRARPGAGASGGLGFGLAALSGVMPSSGFDVIADLVALSGDLAQVDHVLTAEGRLDAQSLLGKGPVRLAAWAERFGVPTTAFVGEALERPSCFTDVITASAGPTPTPGSARAALEAAVRTWASAQPRAR